MGALLRVQGSSVPDSRPQGTTEQLYTGKRAELAWALQRSSVKNEN